MKKILFLLLMSLWFGCNSPNPPAEQHTGTIDSAKATTTRTITIDGVKYEVDPFTYARYKNSAGESVVVQQGEDGSVDIDKADEGQPAEEKPDPQENTPID